MTDKFRAQIRKAYKSTPAYRLDQLLGDEAKWRRRETIARSKLAEVRRKICSMASDAVRREAGHVADKES